VFNTCGRGSAAMSATSGHRHQSEGNLGQRQLSDRTWP